MEIFQIRNRGIYIKTKKVKLLKNEEIKIGTNQ